MAYNPISLNNLKPSTKENPSNPSGRPKGMDVWKFIKKHNGSSKTELLAVVNDDNSKARDIIACQYLLRAISGDIRATEYLVDREEGKPTSTTNVNQSIQGMQFIGQANMDTEQIKTITDTVSDAEQTRLSLLSTMNQSLIMAQDDNDLANNDVAQDDK